MAEPGKGPYCGVASSIILFVILFVLVQWVGAGLIGTNAGGTIVTAILLGAIGVHVWCTYRLEAKRKALRG